MEALLMEGATKLAAEIIIELISITKTALRCQAECRKLQGELENIHPDVNEIELLMQKLQEYDPNAKQDLRGVESWLSRLKQELWVAHVEVYRCNSGSRIGRYCNVPKNYILSTKITAQCEEIRRLADQRVTINLQLVSMRNEYSRKVQNGNTDQNALLLPERRVYGNRRPRR